MRWVLLGALCACVHPNQTDCADGRVCPPQLACDEVNQGCVLPEQLKTCIGIDDGTDCAIDGAATGVCKNQVCITARCGDGFIKGSERCDGENLGGNDSCDDLGYYTTAALSCTADCVFDTSTCAGSGSCGDGTINGPELCEPTMIPTDTTCLDFGYDAGQLACGNACVADFTSCHRFGFFPVSTNTAGIYRAVWPFDDDHVFVAGDGVVARRDLGGWQATPMADNYNDLFGTGVADVWAVGEHLAVAHFDGTTWTTTHLPGTGTLNAVWARAPDDVYAVGYHDVASAMNGIIAHWDGATWSITETVGASTPIARSVFGSAADNVFVGGDAGLVERWTGSTWTDLSSGITSYVAVWTTSATDYYLAAPDAVIHVSGGTSTFLPLGKPVGISSLWDQGTTLYIAATSGVNVFDGTSTVILRAQELIQNVRGTAASLWGVTGTGLLRRFDGTGWLRTSRTTSDVAALGGLSSAFVMAGHDDTDGAEIFDGQKWAPAGGTAMQYVTGLAATSTTTVWETSTTNQGAGAVHRWQSGTLETPPVSTTSGWRGVWAASDTEAVVVGDAGNADYITVPGSYSVVAIGGGSGGNLLSVWGSTISDVYAVGGTLTPGVGAFQHWAGPGNAAWTPISLPGTVHVLRAVWGSGAGDVLVAGDGGYVARGAGATWQVVALPSQENFYSIGGTGPNDVYIGGTNGTIVHWNGTTWTLVRGATTATVTAIYATPREVFFASDGVDILYRPAP